MKCSAKKKKATKQASVVQYWHLCTWVNHSSTTSFFHPLEKFARHSRNPQSLHRIEYFSFSFAIFGIASTITTMRSVRSFTCAGMFQCEPNRLSRVQIMIGLSFGFRIQERKKNISSIRSLFRPSKSNANLSMANQLQCIFPNFESVRTPSIISCSIAIPNALHFHHCFVWPNALAHMMFVFIFTLFADRLSLPSQPKPCYADTHTHLLISVSLRLFIASRTTVLWDMFSDAFAYVSCVVRFFIVCPPVLSHTFASRLGKSRHTLIKHKEMTPFKSKCERARVTV